MSSEKFAELCEGTSEMLGVLAKQARSQSAAGELAYDRSSATETINPLAQIIVAITAATK